MLRAGTADLALTFVYPGRSEPDGLTVATVHEDPLYLVAPRDVDLDGGPFDLARFADDRWVTGCERCRSELLTLCADAGLSPRLTTTWTCVVLAFTEWSSHPRTRQ